MAKDYRLEKLDGYIIAYDEQVGYFFFVKE